MYRVILLFSLLLLSVVASGCGPERNGSSTAEQTQRIASRYATDGDLEGARSELRALDVANANQWLILTTETAISDETPENTLPLVQLTLDLGLTSPVIHRYAIAEGLIDPADQLRAQISEQVSSTSNAGETITSAPSPTTPAQPTAIPTDTPAPVENTANDTGVDTASASDTSASDAPASDASASDAMEVVSETEEAPDVSSAPTEVEISSMPEVARVEAVTPMNVRGGPSTAHPIVAALQGGKRAEILAKNANGDWWQIRLDDGNSGWIYGPLVQTSGDVGVVAVAASIPTAPPPTATPVPAPTQPPAPAEDAPAATAAPEPAEPTDTPPPSGGPDFRLVEHRLWGVEENGGYLAGNSVNCGEKQVLRVIVEDANGNRLNGVTVQGVYRQDNKVTGSKGDGVVEYDMNVDGDDVIVLRDVDGREVTSDRAAGNTAKTYNISHEQLIQGRYCTDAASCEAFIKTNGCFGHFSWTVRFRRSY